MQVGGECDGWEYACFLHSSYYRSPRLLSHNSAVEPAVAGPPSCLADCRLRICAGGTFARIRTTDLGKSTREYIFGSATRANALVCRVCCAIGSGQDAGGARPLRRE